MCIWAKINGDLGVISMLVLQTVRLDKIIKCVDVDNKEKKTATQPWAFLALKRQEKKERNHQGDTEEISLRLKKNRRTQYPKTQDKEVY